MEAPAAPHSAGCPGSAGALHGQNKTIMLVFLTAILAAGLACLLH